VEQRVLPLEEVVSADYPHFTDQMEALLAMFAEYSRRKREHHFLDNDDLLVYFHHRLQDFPDVRRRISSGYQYIMVDEYRTPIDQAQILYLLTDATRISWWSAMTPKAFMHFAAQLPQHHGVPSLFPGARIIGLEENYRSTANPNLPTSSSSAPGKVLQTPLPGPSGSNAPDG
jgi:DNA helicase-2/ATP-dependent DNA helicase PcrA